MGVTLIVWRQPLLFRMKKITAWVFATLILIGLSLFVAFKVEGLPSLNIWGVYKLQEIYMPDRMEATPIKFEGRLYSIVNKRPHRGSWESSELLISNLYVGGDVATVPISGLGLISAVVDDGKVYVFARTYVPGQNELKMLHSSDLKNWTQPTTVMTARPGQNILNTSVTKGPDGFVMAYEVAEPGVIGFTPRFATSPDLKNWTPVGEPFDPKRYSACPTLRYLDGWYYMLYLTIINEKFVTIAARSRDLKTWQHANKPAFQPTDGELKNNSDVDMVQHLGITTFLYAVGDQQDYVALKMAVYLGSEAEFFRQFDYVERRL